jgi:hypothetical protein
VGFAISRLDEEEARRTYELLEHIGMLETDDPELGADAGTTAALSAIRGQ